MGSHVRVAVAQINCTVGDFDGNSRRILDMAARASSAGARILLTPELSLSGYPPEDLLLRRTFYEASDAALARLTGKLLEFPELRVIVGHPLAREGQRYNAVSLLAGGRVRGTYCKHDLPNYDVFDEQRYFTPDNRPLVFEVAGTRFGVNICEDTWFRYAPEAARAAGAQVLLIPNGSPYHLGKQEQRVEVMRENVTRFGLALVYGNMSSTLNASSGSWWNIPVTLTQSLVFLALVLWAARRRRIATRTGAGAGGRGDFASTEAAV